ncbi:MAG: tryptophan 2,3-dioxygenase family protein, partial [Bacteroidota bacterium]
PDMELAVHRLGRICEIWKLLINQITVLETMTPLDFLDFRNLLVPASGFQSYQFRYIEALLGLKMGGRHGKNYYMQQFKSKHINELKDYENTETLLDLVNKWLSRFPFFKGHYWEDYESLKSDNSFWKDYFFLYGESLSNGENKEKKLKDFSLNFMDDNNSDEFTLQVNRTALFIILFRDYPLLQQPFKVIDRLIEVDQLMSTWRYRHMTMVRRMIGMRTGTGGTTGKGYLEGAASHNHIFNNFAGLSTYLIERRNLPRLPKKLIAELSFLKR